jgi:hypothetical protein
MEVEFFDWKEFKMEKLDEQIQNGAVFIGFSQAAEKGKPGIMIKITGKLENSKWTAFVVFEKDGKTRTMSRKNMTTEEATSELRRSIHSAKSILAGQISLPV